ncbi:MAG: BON domain-containing protein [Granulosicoccus sp.]|nr:BON domain-containing protein [Granulosicoccus sp.]
MNIRKALSLSVLVLFAAMAGNVSANISTGSLATDVQSVVGTGNVSVILEDGVATLFGVVETRVDANAAEMAAANFEGVEEVINQLYISH